ncbi:hypothetical protein BK133_30485 [Paenibacillus sp. FSL H8-0548]|nr:hypothetical protein BK133_30485 [Paenibacillus sp. FSL H8-0548]
MKYGVPPIIESKCWHLINQYDRMRTYLLYVTAPEAEKIADSMEHVYELYCFESYEQALEFRISL